MGWLERLGLGKDVWLGYVLILPFKCGEHSLIHFLNDIFDFLMLF